jgi:hypothetical protein
MNGMYGTANRTFVANFSLGRNHHSENFTPWNRFYASSMALVVYLENDTVSSTKLYLSQMPNIEFNHANISNFL